MASHAWIAPVVLLGLWVLSFLWTLLTAPRFDVKHRHVLITGATKGLGLALARSYARAGAKLTLVGRSTEHLEAARAAVEAATTDTVAVYIRRVDLTVPADVDAMVASANAFHGQPPVHVVCAASTAPRGYFVDASVAAMRSAMDLNYFTAVNVVKSTLPTMVEADVRGRFVLVASTEAFHAAADSVRVSGAAFAIKGFAEALRNELKLYGMGVHVFYPGAYATPLPPATSATTPSTPGQDNDTGSPTTAYATFDTTSTAKDDDKLAATLLTGVQRGHSSITTTVAGFWLRALSNGVVPRVNSMFELMVSPIAIALYSLATLVPRAPSAAMKDTANARAATAVAV